MKLEEWQKQNKFIPLTYIEAVQDKPVIVKLDDKFNFVCYPMKPLTFAMFSDAKDGLLIKLGSILERETKDDLERMEKTTDTLKIIMSMIELLYTVSADQYKKGRQREKYRRALFKYGTKNTDGVIELYKTLMEHNTRLEKKNHLPDELESKSGPWGVDKWRGFYAGRGARFYTQNLITVMHEDEEKKLQQIRNYHEQKRKSKENKTNSSRPH
jgi:hypothetical protein